MTRLHETLSRVVEALLLVTLGAVFCTTSQLHLAPIYGALPAAAWHKELTHFVFTMINAIPPSELPLYVWTAVPVFALGRLPLQNALSRVGLIGHSVEYGPVTIEALTLAPLLLLLMCKARNELLQLDRVRESRGARYTTSVVVGLLSLFLRDFAGGLLRQRLLLSGSRTELFSGFSLSMTRGMVELIAVIAATFTMTSVNIERRAVKRLIVAIFILVIATQHARILPSPYTTSLVNSRLAPHGWKILARGESVTGYISVLESTDLQYRLMRCDHSLLGGEWLLTGERRQKESWTVNEPVFGVFQTLEAVRLVQRFPLIARESEKALVVGLGIGTAPKALIAHGINTTIVEIDPLVHQYATEYFSLPTTHTAVLSDAVSWIKPEAVRADKDPNQTYDFIIHDVFTGGASPLALFTFHFIVRLRGLLSAKGVIAINYAGDLSLRPTRNVLQTINVVFEGHCRAFRDIPAPANTHDNTSPAEDPLNLVIFCVNSAEMWPLTFRKPIEADYLGSRSRRQFLMPREEWEIPLPDRSDASTVIMTEAHAENALWGKQQLEAAKRHWKLMRALVPDVVWLNW